METIKFTMPKEMYNQMYFLFLNIKNSQYEDLKNTLDIFLKENIDDGISEEYILFTLKNAFESGEVMGVTITDKTTLRLCNVWFKNTETSKQSIPFEKTSLIKKYEYDIGMIMGVFYFCNKEIFDCDLPFFLTCIESGNLNEITIKNDGITKFHSLIGKLATNGKLGNDWYTDATNSIKIEKRRCSNNGTNKEWLKALEKEISSKFGKVAK